jgi:hypothetical protein
VAGGAAPHLCTPGADVENWAPGDVGKCGSCGQEFTLLEDPHRVPGDTASRYWVMGTLQREQLDQRLHAHLLPASRDPDTLVETVETERDAWVP